MKFYPVKTPDWIPFVFKQWVWHQSKQHQTVFLTFDDGPIPEVTPWVLTQLKKHKAKATFFCIGDNIQKHLSVFEQILEDGHAVGNHTFHHLKGWKTSVETYLQNTTLCQQYLLKQPTKLFRPPYGKITRQQSKTLRKKGYKIVMWDVLSGDFDTQISAEQCTQNVLKHVRNGSIIVFHDSIKAFERLKHTLPVVLENLSKQGYRFDKMK